MTKIFCRDKQSLTRVKIFCHAKHNLQHVFVATKHLSRQQMILVTAPANRPSLTQGCCVFWDLWRQLFKSVEILDTRSAVCLLAYISDTRSACLLKSLTTGLAVCWYLWRQVCLLIALTAGLFVDITSPGLFVDIPDGRFVCLLIIICDIRSVCLLSLTAGLFVRYIWRQVCLFFDISVTSGLFVCWNLWRSLFVFCNLWRQVCLSVEISDDRSVCLLKSLTICVCLFADISDARSVCLISLMTGLFV